MRLPVIIHNCLACLLVLMLPAIGYSQESAKELEAKTALCELTVEPGSIWELAHAIRCQDIPALPTTRQVVEAYAKEPVQSTALYPVMQELLTAALLQEALALQSTLREEASTAIRITVDWPKVQLEITAQARLADLQTKLLALMKRLGPDYAHHFEVSLVLTAVGPWVET